MHPIDRLRAVARAGWAPPDVLATEAAWALADLALHEPQALLPSCRRLLERHPGCGPLWWVSARVLSAGDPTDEALRCGDELDDDRTAELLLEAVPAGARLVRRGGVGDVAGAEIVVVEAEALGPGGMVVDSDVRGLLQAARDLEVPVWVQTGVGRILPTRIWEALARRLGDSTRPDQGHGVTVRHWGRASSDRIVRAGVPETLEGVARVAGPRGVLPLAAALTTADCPEPGELLAPW